MEMKRARRKGELFSPGKGGEELVEAGYPGDGNGGHESGSSQPQDALEGDGGTAHQTLALDAGDPFITAHCRGVGTRRECSRLRLSTYQQIKSGCHLLSPTVNLLTAYSISEKGDSTNIT